MHKFFKELFYNQNSKYFIKANNLLALIVIIAIISLILETVNEFADYQIIFNTIEIISTLIFTIEYLGRITGSRKPLSYIFSFFGLIDLLTVLPTFLGLGNLIFIKSLRGLRVLRFLRMLRLVKILELKKNKQDEEEKHDKENKLFILTLEIYLAIFMGTALLSGTAMYLLEGYREVFSNVPLAMLWSLKVLVGGVSQVLPETIGGDVVVIITRFFGLILLALMIGVITIPIKKYLLHDKKDT